MQSSYVLCRLFKKNDETIEDSNCGEAEPTVSSSTAAISSSQDTQSDHALVSPSSERQDEKLPTIEECTIADSSNGMESDIQPPIEGPSTSCNGYYAEDQMHLRLEDLPVFYDHPPEPLFSPLHSQMQAELFYCGSNPLNNANLEVTFQYGTNEHDGDISEFLNTILNSSGEVGGVDAKVAEVPVSGSFHLSS